TVKRLAIRVVFAIAGYAAKAHAPRSTGKATDRQRHAINDANQVIMADQGVTQRHPQTLFDRPQIGGLSDKGRAMQVSKTGEKVGIMLSEEGQERFILTDPQVRAHHFHGQYLAIQELGHRASLAE